MSPISKNFHISTLSACLSLVLSAGAMSNVANAAEPSVSQTASSEVRVAQASKVSLKQAIDIASKKASGRLISAEFDDDDDKAQGGVYEIEFSSASQNHEIKVDANTGKIIDTKTKDLDSGDVADYKALKQVNIHIMKAMSIAEKKTSGRVLEIEFKNDRDYDNRTSYYEVEVLKEDHIIELKVDASTGEIFNSKVKK